MSLYQQELDRLADQGTRIISDFESANREAPHETKALLVEVIASLAAWGEKNLTEAEQDEVLEVLEEVPAA